MGQASVSIRELKSRLSHFLRLTKAGESLIITDHGTPIGRIVPIVQTAKGLDERLAGMKQAGQLEWPATPRRTGPEPCPPDEAQ